MSSIVVPNDTATAMTTMPTTETRPEHHVHRDSEPLPGAGKGAAPAADYSTQNMERLPSSAWQENPSGDAPVPTRELGAEHEGMHKRTDDIKSESAPKDAVADPHVDSRQPARKPTAADKIVGKAQEVAGKMAHKPELQEKGMLRQTEGKDAAANM